MVYASMGMTLEIDLSRRAIHRRPNDPELVAAYLGGKGTNAKLLWDRVPPEVDAFSPDNLLIVGAGLLTGTVIPGANRTCVTYKSPVTNIHCYSNLGGFFAAELKHAGYDSIVISGKSATPVYLWINDDHVELRDASHLWGKSPSETRKQIRQELKNNQVQTLSIGLAGENLVYFATIEHGLGASASRGGAGAIMGDKKLKAIAVHGTKDVAVASPSRLADLSDQIVRRTYGTRTRIVERSPYTYFRFGVNWGDEGNCSGVRTAEHEEEIKHLGRKAADFIGTTRQREAACHNCVIRCKHVYRNSYGEYSYVKCAPYYAMIASQVLEPGFSIACQSLYEKYGLDLYTTGNCIAFAIDLYKKGILTTVDADGLHLDWKEPAVVFALIEKIARREGLGDILANGTYRAARQIGNGAEEYAFHAKKLDLHMLKVFHQHHMAIGAALTDKGDIAKLGGGALSLVVHRPLEERKAYIDEGWFIYPEEYAKDLLAGDDATRTPALEANCRFSAYDAEEYTLADATGLCVYWVGFWLHPAINSRALIAGLISATTGMDIDDAGATAIARRIENLVRAYNIREGLRRKDDFDSVPKHAFERTPLYPEVKLEPATLNRIIDTFYRIKGWNSEGIPTEVTLAKSGLNFVRQDLERRGIVIN